MRLSDPRDGAAGRYFPALDGLRGIAALLVVFYHLEIQAGRLHYIHGYAAVDLFFALSGFVIALNYESKFAAGMGLGAFARIRLIRLYPLMLLGGVMGLGVALFRGDHGLAPLFLAQVFWVPVLAGSAMLYPLNSVHWSLLFEAAANLAHASFLKSLSARAIAAITALGGVGVIASDWLYADTSRGFNLHTLWVGLARVAFGYGLGVLLFRIHRAGRLPISKAPFGLIGAVLVSAMFLTARMHRFGDLLLVFVVLPAVLVAGIGAAPSQRLLKLEKWLGEISFPVYAIHYPLIALWVALKFPLNYPIEAGLLVAIAALATAVGRGDAHARRWLTRSHQLFTVAGIRFRL